MISLDASADRLVDRLVDRPNESQSVKLILTLEATLGSIGDDWLAKIENAQRANPRDTRLQYLAGMAFKAHSLWGKAQQQLSQAAPQLKVSSLKRNAWLALAELAEQRGETAAAVQAWKQAAQI